MRGTLYVVATPIGNLEDLSARALATLRTARLVACEDTRVTRAILDRHAITVPLMSSHKFNETAAARRILEVLADGGDVALVSDGGTPGVSDPGDVAVRAARAAGARVLPIPGPSAAAALWSVSGFSGAFTVQGFLPSRGGERRRALEALAAETRPFVLYESPHRILATLDDAAAILGDRDCCLGREMTKVHEEFLAGSLSSVRARLAAGAVRGEFALVVAGRPAQAARGTPGDVDAAADEARRLIATGLPRAEAVRRAARAAGVPRRALYQYLLADDGVSSHAPGGTVATGEEDSEE
jgi:16S rRNA (cytidine1402-2'-O)-methyltransferase